MFDSQSRHLFLFAYLLSVLGPFDIVSFLVLVFYLRKQKVRVLLGNYSGI